MRILVGIYAAILHIRPSDSQEKGYQLFASERSLCRFVFILATRCGPPHIYIIHAVCLAPYFEGHARAGVYVLLFAFQTLSSSWIKRPLLVVQISARD
jgi:hypothetical protein